MKKNHENSDVYVRLDSSSAHDAKRDLLEMTESVIHMQMISEKLKKFQKEELSGRDGSRKQLKMMTSEINQIMARMPKVKVEKTRAEKVHEIKVESAKTKGVLVPKKVERKTLNQELEDIRMKIESLKKQV
ncbi:MAG: hypothetical protein KKE23_02665 [Nanoarchaeota archaeon]|nr:hypothetical protein [Nanoarchaeota archaeon]